MHNIDYNIIDKVLSFFNLKIKKGDTISVVNKNNKIIYKASISRFKDIISNESNLSFNTDSTSINYSKQDNNYFLDYHIKNQIDYYIKISKKGNVYSDITILTADINEEYPIRKFSISDDGFSIEICNKFNPFTHEDDEIKKSIIARNPKDSYNPILSISNKKNGEEIDMVATKLGVTINGIKRIKILDNWQYNQLANNIILHSENKNLFINVVDKINEQLPGSKEFIQENFDLYNTIINTPYKTDPIAEVLLSEVKEINKQKQKTLAS